VGPFLLLLLLPAAVQVSKQQMALRHAQATADWIQVCCQKQQQQQQQRPAVHRCCCQQPAAFLC
jgi:hypothetical protein